MVLLCNDNSIIIKRHHILKCLNKDRDNFKVVVQPASSQELQESMKSNNIDFDIDIKELNKVLADGKTKNKR